MDRLLFQRASFGGKQDVCGQVVRTIPPMADSSLSNADDLRGKVAIVRRGYVTFDEKARRVQEAGAVGMIVLNWANNAPILDSAEAAGGESADDITIPVVCVKQDQGEKLTDGQHVLMAGDGLEDVKSPHERCEEATKVRNHFPRFAGLIDGTSAAEHSVEIEGILGMEFHTLEAYDKAVKMFEHCMASWEEVDALFQDATSYLSARIAAHGKHLHVARSCRQVLGDLDACNDRALRLIREGSFEQAASALAKLIAELHIEEKELAGRDCLRISLFEIPQKSYKILQQALLSMEGNQELALVVATAGKARSLSDMLESLGKDDQLPNSAEKLALTFRIGDEVRLTGLKNHAHLNGKTGIVSIPGETVLVDVDGEPQPLRFALRNVVHVDENVQCTMPTLHLQHEMEWPDLQRMVQEEGCKVVEYSWLLEGELVVWVISEAGELKVCKTLSQESRMEIEQLNNMARAAMEIGSARSSDIDGIQSKEPGDAHKARDGGMDQQLVQELVLLLMRDEGDSMQEEMKEEMKAELQAIKNHPARRRELEQALNECKAVREWLEHEANLAEQPLESAIERILPSVMSWGHLRDLSRTPKILERTYGIQDSLSRAKLWELVASHLDESRLLRRMHDILIEPIDEALLGTKEVLFVPHEILFSVPWAALLDKRNRHLMQKFAVRVAPSLRVVRSALSSGCKVESGSTAVVIGNPWPNDYGFLRHAEEEAALVCAELQQTGAFDRVDVATKSRAVKPWVEEKLRGSSLAHFACHATHDGGKLILAHSEQEQNGELTMQEVQERAQLRAGSCVVLSACNTGNGVVTPDGVVGLSRGFLAAGAGSVVVSLWTVGDQSTKVLMSHFYASLGAGSSVSEAMQTAMLTMADVPLSPQVESSDSDEDDGFLVAPFLPVMSLLRLPAAGECADGRSATNAWGKQEMRALQLLFNEGMPFSFHGNPLEIGNGINQRGYFWTEASLELFGVSLYTQVWGEDGPAVHRGQSSVVKIADLGEAVTAVKSSISMRVDNQARLGREKGHDFMLSQLRGSCRRLKLVMQQREEAHGGRGEAGPGSDPNKAGFSARHWAGFIVTGANVRLRWPPASAETSATEAATHSQPRGVGRMSVAEVCAVLRGAELEQYCASFEDNGIDSLMLEELEELWDELGVTMKAHRIKILKSFGLRK